MKIFKSLLVLIFLAGNLPLFLNYASAESSTVAVSISFTVLGTLPAQLQQYPDARECLQSQLQKNPQSLAQIKVEELTPNAQSSAAENYRFTICERP